MSKSLVEVEPPDGEAAASFGFAAWLQGALLGVVTLRIDVPENAGVSVVARLGGVDGMNPPPIPVVVPSSSTGQVLARLLRIPLGCLSHDPSPLRSIFDRFFDHNHYGRGQSYASVNCPGVFGRNSSYCGCMDLLDDI